MMSRGGVLRLLCLLPVSVFCFSCDSSKGSGEPQASSMRTVTVQVSLPANTAPLPAGAAIDIRVVEVSGPDRAIVGTLQPAPAMSPDGGTYAVECKASRIREAASYGLEVAVVANGKALYRNRQAYYVLTRGNPDHVRVQLQ